MRKLARATQTSILLTCASSLAVGCGMAPALYDGYGDYGDYEPAVPPVSDDGDQYDPVGTNPFVEVSHDPFSTFGADVDSASYDIFLRNMGQNMLPSPDSVRLEEYVNFFDYDYPAPAIDATEPFSITMDAGPHIVASETTILRIGIQGADVDASQKKPANLVFLVDTSGSMASSTKLGLVKLVLSQTVDLLGQEDTVAIVTYAGSTRVALEPTPAFQKQTILQAVDAMTADGSTNGAGGIQLAYLQAEAGFIEGGINHVLLCTDGDFNVGVSSDAGLVELIEEKRQTGITLTVLGFGMGNLNDSMMEKITNAGNGTYGVISSAAQAVDYVEKRMLSNLILIAKDVKIQVEFNPALVHAYRLLGYENRAIADDEFRDDAVDGGEIGAGHRVTALYELVLAGQQIPHRDGAPEVESGEPVSGDRQIDAADLAMVSVRYKAVDADTQDPAIEVSASLGSEEIAQERSAADRDRDWALAVAAFAEVLKNSPYAQNEALDIIEAVIDAQADRDGERSEFADLFDAARSLLSTR